MIEIENETWKPMKIFNLALAAISAIQVLLLHNKPMPLVILVLAFQAIPFIIGIGIGKLIRSSMKPVFEKATGKGSTLAFMGSGLFYVPNPVNLTVRSGSI